MVASLEELLAIYHTLTDEEQQQLIDYALQLLGDRAPES